MGKGSVKKGYVELKIKDIIKIVDFDLGNCYIKLGEIILRQKWGVLMGSPLSPILAIVICIKYEVVFKATLGSDNKIKIKRYMDDMWGIVKYKINHTTEKQCANKAITDLKSYCYHPRMIVETEGVSEKIDFLECRIEKKKGKWRGEYRVKNEERKEAGVKKLKKFMEYESYGSGEKVGIVIGAMARIEQNCTDNEGRVKGVIGVVSDLHAAGYPN